MSETKDKTQQSLEQRLKTLAAIDVEEELIRNDELGQANFRPGVPIFKQTLDLFRELQVSQLEVFPEKVLNKLNDRAGKALNHFENVKKFTLSGYSGDVVEARNKLLHDIEQEYETHFEVLQPHINYLLIKKTDFASLEQQARDAMARLEKFTADRRSEQERIQAEMGAALDSVKAAAAKAGVAQQSVVFNEQADNHAKQVRTWMWASAGFGFIALMYALVFFALLPIPTGTVGETIQSVISRLVVLSIILFGLVFSGRQLVAAQHNETVNRHRQNALQTFETFVQASDDSETKDAVLLEATRSIFSAQPTGFLRRDGERESPSTVIEVLRRITTTTRDGE